MPSVLFSVNEIFIESLSSPRVALDKKCFTECAIKYTRQSDEHSVKSHIVVTRIDSEEYVERPYYIQ
jgi:hypothetical protein